MSSRGTNKGARTRTTTGAMAPVDHSASTETVVGRRVTFHDERDLRAATNQWAAKMSVKITSLSFADLPKKWGSMDTAGHMTLSRALLSQPARLAEYVMVHELAHRVAPNHGVIFTSLLHAYMPDWQQRQSELDKSGISVDGAGRAKSTKASTTQAVTAKPAATPKPASTRELKPLPGTEGARFDPHQSPGESARGLVRLYGMAQMRAALNTYSADWVREAATELHATIGKSKATTITSIIKVLGGGSKARTAKSTTATNTTAKASTRAPTPAAQAKTLANAVQAADRAYTDAVRGGSPGVIASHGLYTDLQSARKALADYLSGLTPAQRTKAEAAVAKLTATGTTPKRSRAKKTA